MLSVIWIITPRALEDKGKRKQKQDSPRTKKDERHGGEHMVSQTVEECGKARDLTGSVDQSCALKELDSDLEATSGCDLSTLGTEVWFGDTFRAVDGDSGD